MSQDVLALVEAGNAERQAGNFLDAAKIYARACSLAPGRDDLGCLLGDTLLQLGRDDLALSAFATAASVNPANAHALLNAGHILRSRHDYAGALDYYDRAMEQRPDWYLPRLSAANALSDQGQLDLARGFFDQALAMGAPPGCRWLKAGLLPLVPRDEAEIDAARAALDAELEALEADPPMVGNPLTETPGSPFLLAYHGQPDRALHERIGRLYARSCPRLVWRAPHLDHPRRPGPRRVAVVSHSLCAHSVGRYFVALVEALAAAGAEVSLFTPLAAPDPIRRRYEGAARQVTALPADPWSARLRVASTDPDVVLFIDQGFNPLTYFLAFARLAPVQATVLGHPVTSGLPEMDYFLSCAAAEPEGAQDHYSERLVALDGPPTCYPEPPAPDGGDRAAFGLPAEGRLYLFAQNLFKLHPQMDPAFAALVQLDGAARIALVAGHDPAWSEAAEARLRPILGDRLVMLPRLSDPQFQGLLSVSDVCLDSFHFSGANTSFQSLAVGTPVVTLPGAFVRGRQTLGIYAATGARQALDELVARDAEDWAAKAVAAATRPSLRPAMQQIFAAAQADRRPAEQGARFLMEAQPITTG